MKGIVISIVIIVCLITIVSLFLPSKITVSKSILINASPADVACQIQDFKNWKNWYPSFQSKEISITTLDTLNDLRVKSVALNDNHGRTIILMIIPSLKNTITVDLQTGNKATITYQFITEPHGTGQTLLIWNVNTMLGWYPWKKIQGIIMDKITGPQYMSTLQNLKEAVETKAVYSQDK